MSLFFIKCKVWFEEAAFINHVEHVLRYDGFKGREHSLRVVLLTVFTVVWMVFSFPFQANASTASVKSESDANLFSNEFADMVANAQVLTVGDVAVQVVARDAITVVEAPKPVESKRILPAGPVGTPTEAQAYAQSLVGGGEEWSCLYNLWARESGWRVEANNQSSGAYGIPQALPGSKMASVGADWQTNYVTQIQWGLGYINGRYGSPCGAWAHSEDVGWY